MTTLSKNMPVRPFTLDLAKPQPGRKRLPHFSWICPGDPKLDPMVRLRTPELPLWLIVRQPVNDNPLAPLN